jgi:hypothetical protein
MKISIVGTAAVLFAMTLFATGCGKSRALEISEEYEKAACACKDSACATAATKKYGESAKEMVTAKGSEAEPITKATTNATECVTKLAMAGVPGMK